MPAPFQRGNLRRGNADSAAELRLRQARHDAKRNEALAKGNTWQPAKAFPA
jgi:hypothetical protein